MNNNKILEKALAFIWRKIEQNNFNFNEINKELKSFFSQENILDELIKKQYIKADFSNKIEFTEEGYKIAYDLIRRHRLTERLLVDVLNMDKLKIHFDAYEIEHIISKELEESICTLLGHPKTCPHGSKIMPGECCKKNISQIERMIFKLSELNYGENAKIVYIQTNDKNLQKIMTFGLLPGTKLKVLRTFPAFIIEFDHTQVAFESEIAENIYVKKLL